MKVVESFIDFIEAKGKAAQNISTMILEKLEKDGIDIQNCGGQACGDAALVRSSLTSHNSELALYTRRSGQAVLTSSQSGLKEFARDLTC